MKHKMFVSLKHSCFILCRIKALSYRVKNINNVTEHEWRLSFTKVEQRQMAAISLSRDYCKNTPLPLLDHFV